MNKDQNQESKAKARAKKLEQSANWVRHSTVGFQFAGSMVLFVLGGWWLDEKFDSSPWMLLLCASVGCFGSFVWLYYQIYPESSKPQNKPTSNDDADHQD